MNFSKSINIPPEFMIAWKMSEAAWCLKDIKRKLVFSNEKYSALITPSQGSKQPPLSIFSNCIAQHDIRVIEEKKKIDAIGIFPPPYVNDLSIFLCERMPFYDCEEKVVGVVSRITPLKSMTPLFFVTGDEGQGVLTTSPPSKIFTDKEWVVVFLMLLGCREKDISRTINRTVRTIKFHKSNILQKTACETTNDFILLARHNKWQFSVPPMFCKSCYIIK